MERRVRLTVRRQDPASGCAAYYQTWEVPAPDGATVLDLLDYVSEKLDPTIAYYDHAACQHGICRRCTVLVNGKVGLVCQTPVAGDLTLEPPPGFIVVRDLVYDRARGRRAAAGT